MRRAVLRFFDERRRSLPWRVSTDPYRVWVSEIMLQQTRVEAVIPYYERWLAQFPSLQALAAASPDAVLRAWEGLGYYTRARNLHRAARVVLERHGGSIPTSAAALRTLPGIGAYTAGAIASIAFGEAVPAIDGNARRVLSRLHDADLGPADLHDAALALIPASRPGDFNQGLMELGATVCAPRRPLCPGCPLRTHCRACAAGTQVLRPTPRRRPAPPEFHLLTLVLESGGRVLLTRSAEGLLAGLWRFPSTPLEGDVASAAHAELRRLTGAGTDSLIPLGAITHAFTHRREQYHVVHARLNMAVPAAARGDELEWHPSSSLPLLPLPVAQRRIARLAGF